jgi:hypothetical protein
MDRRMRITPRERGHGLLLVVAEPKAQASAGSCVEAGGRAGVSGQVAVRQLKVAAATVA